MRRRPSATDPGIRDGPFPQARKATPAAHQGGLLGASEGKCRPEAVLLVKFEPDLLPQLRKERGAVPSRGDEDLRCEWSGSGSDAGSARIGARARGGNFHKWFARESSTWSLQTTPFNFFEGCHVDPFHLPSSTCDCDGGSDLMLQKNKSVEQEMMSLLRLLQFVVIATCLLGFSLKCGAERSVIPARFLLMSSRACVLKTCVGSHSRFDSLSVEQNNR